MIRLRRRRCAPFFTAILVAGLCLPAPGDTLTLPLGGYFHPGRAMPVRWDSSGTSVDRTLVLAGDDAIGSRVQLSNASHVVFPWLAFDGNVRDIRCQTPPSVGFELPPLHPLDDSSRLIASTLDDDSPAIWLFPGRSIVPVHLDPAHPIDGPAMAWETVDAMLFTPSSFSRIPPATRDELFAVGVELAVLGDSMPDTRLPWRRDGGLWLASSGLMLPPIIDAAAYDPALGWTAGRSVPFRRRIVFLAAIFCLAACGVALWRSRWMPLALAAVALAAILLFTWDNARQSPVASVMGMIRIPIAPVQLNDAWLYQSSHRDADFHVPLTGMIAPVFADVSQAPAANLVIECNENGEPTALTGRLKADWPLAIMQRQIAPAQEIPLISPVRSPLRLLAVNSIYPHCSIAGQAANDPSDWPAVILKINPPSQSSPDHPTDQP